jgi:hypothetical protein
MDNLISESYDEKQSADVGHKAVSFREYKPLNLQSMKQLTRDSSLQSKKLQRDISLMQGLSFRPKLNENSSRMAESFRKKQSLGTNTFENLYKLDKIRKQHLETKRQQV